MEINDKLQNLRGAVITEHNRFPHVDNEIMACLATMGIADVVEDIAAEKGYEMEDKANWVLGLPASNGNVIFVDTMDDLDIFNLSVDEGRINSDFMQLLDNYEEIVLTDRVELDKYDPTDPVMAEAFDARTRDEGRGDSFDALLTRVDHYDNNIKSEDEWSRVVDEICIGWVNSYRDDFMKQIVKSGKVAANDVDELYDDAIIFERKLGDKIREFSGGQEANLDEYAQKVLVAEGFEDAPEISLEELQKMGFVDVDEWDDVLDEFREDASSNQCDPSFNWA